MFPVTSRYYGLEIAKLEQPNGKTVVYLRRRFLPDPNNAVIFAEHRVSQGERLDNITARYLGDPEQFWRIGDANNALRAEELTKEIGRRLKLPLPQ